MFRVVKTLNHNSVLAIKDDSNKEYIILGKGVGFGKKVNERIEEPKDAQIYLLQEQTERGYSDDIVRNIDPEILEITNSIILQAQKKFDDIDTNILCTLADHIAFAIERMEKNEEIQNPLTADIKALFQDEFEVGYKAKEIIKDVKGIEINEDEIGYIALHIHSSLGEESISQAMKTAAIVRSCIDNISRSIGKEIDVNSLAYNRLMSHIKYMITRAIKGEEIKLDMNEYISERFPKSFNVAEEICKEAANSLKKNIGKVEVGYLAMHIERVLASDIY